MKWMLLFVSQVERDRAVFESDPRIGLLISGSVRHAPTKPTLTVTGVVSKWKRVQLPENIINQQMFNFLLARNFDRI